MGDDHSTYITENDVNVSDLYRFITDGAGLHRLDDASSSSGTRSA